jgi:hypothetical protein
MERMALMPLGQTPAKLSVAGAKGLAETVVTAPPLSLMAMVQTVGLAQISQLWLSTTSTPATACLATRPLVSAGTAGLEVAAVTSQLWVSTTVTPAMAALAAWVVALLAALATRATLAMTATAFLGEMLLAATAAWVKLSLHIQA